MKELKNTVVNVKTEEEYEELINMYEKAGWKSFGGSSPKHLDMYRNYEEETTLEAENRFATGSIEISKSLGRKIISLQEFKNMQEKTFKTLEVGDLIQDVDGYYRKILAVLNRGDEVNESVYSVSSPCVDKTSTILRESYGIRTSYELEEYEYKIVTKPKKMTVDEIAKELGYEFEITK